MKYLEIGIETRREGIELILSALMNLGITDAVVEDPAMTCSKKKKATNGIISMTAYWS